MSRIAVLLAFVIASSAAALAQTTFGSITGTITDASGAAVPSAHVKATELESGYSYESQSTSDGLFTLPNLREGTYTVVQLLPVSVRCALRIFDWLHARSARSI